MATKRYSLVLGTNKTKFIADLSILQKSSLIKNLLADVPDDDDAITLEHIDANLFIDIYRLAELCPPSADASNITAISPQVLNHLNDYCNGGGTAPLFALLNTAHYFGFADVEAVLVAYIIRQLNGKTIWEMRKILGAIPSHITEESDRRDHALCGIEYIPRPDWAPNYAT